MGYQSFDDRPGNSLTKDKLSALKLPASLAGKRLLDLGCNEGFFCLEAKRRGADVVVGVDADARLVELARGKAKAAELDVEFRLADMTKPFPDEKFDFILLLSALHYINEPAKLLAKVANLLAPGGVFILEAGVADTPGMTVVRALRSIDERFFPTTELLTKVWLKDYSVRRVGSSVAQAGDPIPRSVFHCTPKKTSVVMLLGKGGIGKSTLAGEFDGAPVISTDRLFNPYQATPHKAAPVQEKYLAAYQKTGSIWAVWDSLKDDPATRKYFTKVVADAIRHCAGAGVVVVEGYVLDALTKDIIAELGEDYLCWESHRTPPAPRA